MDEEDDLADDDADGILVEGEKISKHIMEEAKAHGRRRHLRSRTREEVQASSDRMRAAVSAVTAARQSRGAAAAAERSVVRQEGSPVVRPGAARSSSEAQRGPAGRLPAARPGVTRRRAT